MALGAGAGARSLLATPRHGQHTSTPLRDENESLASCASLAIRGGFGMFGSFWTLGVAEQSPGLAPRQSFWLELPVFATCQQPQTLLLYKTKNLSATLAGSTSPSDPSGNCRQRKIFNQVMICCLALSELAQRDRLRSLMPHKQLRRTSAVGWGAHVVAQTLQP